MPPPSNPHRKYHRYLRWEEKKILYLKNVFPISNVHFPLAPRQACVLGGFHPSCSLGLLISAEPCREGKRLVEGPILMPASPNSGSWATLLKFFSVLASWPRELLKWLRSCRSCLGLLNHVPPAPPGSAPKPSVGCILCE